MNEISQAKKEIVSSINIYALPKARFVLSLALLNETKAKCVYLTNFINELLAVKYRRQSQIIS